jgi:hypothetical protein
MERRTFLRASVLGTGAIAFSGGLWQNAARAAPAQNAPGPYGPLQAADANGIELPAGFTSQIIARSGQSVPGTSYSWHSAPDGGACFADGSGWIYVSNAGPTTTAWSALGRRPSPESTTSPGRPPATSTWPKTGATWRSA